VRLHLRAVPARLTALAVAAPGQDNRAVTAFTPGQHGELYPIIASQRGASIVSGTRGIVQDVDPDRADDAIYLVAFLSSERLPGEQARLRGTDLFPA
jgi:hypothetical protein